MKKIIKKFQYSIIIMMFFFLTKPYADEYRVLYSLTLPTFVGAGFANDYSWLQSRPSIGHRIDFAIRSGTKNGILYGLGYGIQKYNHQQNATTLRSPGTFKSNYSFGFAKVGYWHSLEKNAKIEASLNGGYGNFNFKRNSEDDSYITRAYSISLDARLILPIVISTDKAINLFVGVEILKPYLKSFTYHNQEYNSSDFALQYVLPIGIGFEF